MKPSVLLATTAGAVLLATSLTGCAKHTHEIQPQYVSPVQYNSYSCQQIEREMASLSTRVSEVGRSVNDEASSDDMEMGVGLILFWPTLFFLDGDTPQANEYARLRGEFDALEKAANQKNCGIAVERPVIAPSATPAQEQKRQSANPHRR